MYLPHNQRTSCTTPLPARQLCPAAVAGRRSAEKCRGARRSVNPIDFIVTIGQYQWPSCMRFPLAPPKPPKPFASGGRTAARRQMSGPVCTRNSKLCAAKVSRKPQQIYHTVRRTCMGAYIFGSITRRRWSAPVRHFAHLSS